jgi:hypothetical protein
MGNPGIGQCSERVVIRGVLDCNVSMSQAALAAYGTVVRLLSEEHLPEDALAARR